VEPENPLKLAEHTPMFCSHESISIDKHARSITCTKCGANLDPFDFLAKSAATVERAWASYKYAKNAESEVSERVALLKKQEHNLRAQVKRLQEKVPTISRL
jgi:hypothetical protein